MYLRVKCGHVLSLGGFCFVKLMAVHFGVATPQVRYKSDSDLENCVYVYLLGEAFAKC